MTLTAGALSLVSVGANSASLSSAVATSGTAPYTYQWYRSTTTGFSPGPSTLLSGATSLTLNDTALVPNTPYFYVVKVTDSASPAATANSAQLAVTTTGTQLSQNALNQVTAVGMVDMNFNFNTKSAIVDSSIGSGLVYPGQAVKIVANTSGGVPRVIPVAASSDNVFGFVNYNVKNASFSAGQALEVSCGGNVIWLYSTGAITQGAQVCLDASVVGGVQATGNSASVVGFALSGVAAAASLIKVELKCPSFATA